MTESPKDNKIPFPNKSKLKRIEINLNTIFIGVGIVLLVVFASNFFNTGSNGNEVSINNFVSSIKDNKYSVVNIQDDGRAIALGKTFYFSETDNEITLKDQENTDVFNSDAIGMLESASLYDLIKPLSLSETLQTITEPNKIQRAKELYIAENYILITPLSKDNKNLLVKDFGEVDFKKMLSEKGMQIDQLPIKVYYLASEATKIDTQNLADYYNNGRLEKIWELDGVYLAMINSKDVTKDYVYWKSASESLSNFTDFLQKEGIKFDITNIKINFVKTVQIPWGDIISTGFLVALIVVAIFMLRGVQSSGSGLMKFGQSKARMFFGRKPDTTFKDVAGIDEAKEELMEIVMFLKAPKKFLEMGARIPKGVLMVGAPGTGKTLLARAIAGEAAVPFFHTSGSEFEEMLVGAGASRVRDLFDKAKKAAPSLIFIDEIDAVARKRGTTIQSGTTEQTLNQILVEMDGFEKNQNVIVIAATNRPDVLDPAILRPGRFDRRIVLDLPDIQGRKEIIAIHAANKPISKEVDLEKIARRTVGFSGADIENMLNEAAIITAKADRKEITSADLEEAATKVQVGPEKKRKRTEKELKMTAYHEAGHALVMKMVPDSDPIHRITIISRGMALGYTMPLPVNDQLQMTKTQMLSQIKSLLAGHITEKLIFKDVTSGAANDIEKATRLARRMVKHFGMSKSLGLVKYGNEEDEPLVGYGYGEGKDYSEDTAKTIDEEVRGIISDCYKGAEEILVKNRTILDKLVETLLEKETIEAEEFLTFFE
jgi:cell division protease FtsH